MRENETEFSEREIIISFYEAFANLDAEAMVSYYHDKIIFKDPAFGVLKGERAKNMWRMLCHSQRGKNFKVNASRFIGSNQQGSAYWEAYYTFRKTGRKVHNKIDAVFAFEDGKIIQHIDQFSLYDWAKQAFGLKGVLLGKTRFFKTKLQRQTNALLDKFEATRKS
ncbi:nuclear transport factor 2 family protein [Flavobacteriaceae bacterium F08102]|nr:nuclear transport factor 2 family protein [Flavobacteriaceae bacterium F08102]